MGGPPLRQARRRSAVPAESGERRAGSQLHAGEGAGPHPNPPVSLAAQTPTSQGWRPARSLGSAFWKLLLAFQVGLLRTQRSWDQTRLARLCGESLSVDTGDSLPFVHRGAGRPCSEVQELT